MKLGFCTVPVISVLAAQVIRSEYQPFHNRRLAIFAPSTIAASFAHATSG
jgi:hypothetical protein